MTALNTRAGLDVDLTVNGFNPTRSTPTAFKPTALRRTEYALGISNTERIAALVNQAWELRNTPYLRDACEAIVDEHFRRHLTELERRMVRNAWLIKVLKETA